MSTLPLAAKSPNNYGAVDSESLDSHDTNLSKHLSTINKEIDAVQSKLLNYQEHEKSVDLEFLKTWLTRLLHDRRLVLMKVTSSENKQGVPDPSVPATEANPATAPRVSEQGTFLFVSRYRDVKDVADTSMLFLPHFYEAKVAFYSILAPFVSLWSVVLGTRRCYTSRATTSSSTSAMPCSILEMSTPPSSSIEETWRYSQSPLRAVSWTSTPSTSATPSPGGGGCVDHDDAAGSGHEMPVAVVYNIGVASTEESECPGAVS